MPSLGFFKPGNKYSQGRPPKNKCQIERIRSRILRVVRRRVMHEKDLESVTTTELLKFLAAIMPKDVGISVQAPQINYISNIPRELPILDRIVAPLELPGTMCITEEEPVEVKPIQPEESNGEPPLPQL